MGLVSFAQIRNAAVKRARVPVAVIQMLVTNDLIFKWWQFRGFGSGTVAERKLLEYVRGEPLSASHEKIIKV